MTKDQWKKTFQRSPFSFNRNSVVDLLKHFVLVSLGVMISAHVVDGISYKTDGDLVAAVLLLGVLNIVLKPFLILFTLPFIVLTMGLGILVINGFLFVIVGKFVEGFVVADFMSAFWGALIVSLTSLLANALLGSARKKVERPQGGVGPGKKIDKDDDVIDI